MTGFLQRAQVTGGDTVVAALREHIANAAALVEDAVLAEQQDFAERQQAAAEADPQWAPLAQHMGAWEDEDGNYAHGVQGDDLAVSNAGRLEFGDETNPPSPLIRMGVLSQVSNIRQRLESNFRRGGY